MNWWPAMLGWPAIMISLGLAVVGIVHRKAGFFVVAVLLMLPVSLYLSSTPRIGLYSLIPPLLLIGSGFSVRQRKQSQAWLLLVPVVIGAVWLAVIVVSPAT